MNFEAYLKDSLNHVEDGIVKEAALYALTSGGKRVRPNLLFSVLKSYGLNEEIGTKVGCAIEMMHTYSLIHDDLPAMDNDTLRRGKPTCHVKYGEGIAILAGDALLTHSFEMMSNASDDSKVSIALVKELACNSGLNGMIYGQELDISNEDNKDISAEQLVKIHHHKTGNLIALPMVCGAILASSFKDIEIWRKIGFIIGLLFQIQDDVFDLTKTSDELGKNANSDANNNKITYVSLFGVEKCKDKINELYQQALVLLDGLSLKDKRPVMKVLENLMNRSN